MPHRTPKRFRRLTRQSTTRLVRNRPRKPKWQAIPDFVENRFGRKSRRFRIQRIKNGLDDQRINTPFNQTNNLLAVRQHQLIKADRAIAWIIDVGRKRSRFIRWTNRTHDPPGPLSRGRIVSTFARHTRSSHIDFMHEGFATIVSLANALSIETVGLDDV